MFVLNSDIKIGKFRFSGVDEVRITRSLHSIADTATIRLPSISRIITEGKSAPGNVITGKQFSDGDPVTIKLGYNGNLQTEFSGFVKRRDLNMPLKIVCEGYSGLLRRNTVNGFWKTITVKDLLLAAVAGTDTAYSIKVQCDIDCELNNISIANKSGFDVINNISKYADGALSCFFIKPDTLWCGLVYTPYATGDDTFALGQVSYELGYNVVKDNSLKERLTENDPVEVTYTKKLSRGTQVFGLSDAFQSFTRTRSKILNHITGAAVLKQLANEKAYRLNYSGYEGNINAFLQPYATPGYVAYLKDNRYPERDGSYIIESTTVHFGINGARRILEIGPQVGFAND